MCLFGIRLKRSRHSRNPYAKHIISCDVLSRSLTPEGTLHTRRLILKSGSLPVWAQAIVGGWGGLVTYVVEDSWVSARSI